MIRTFVDRPIGTSMGALAVALLGVVACPPLPVDLLPSLELPGVSVQMSLEGPVGGRDRGVDHHFWCGD